MGSDVSGEHIVEKAVRFLMGKVMQQTHGRADPSTTRQLILERLLKECLVDEKRSLR